MAFKQSVLLVRKKSRLQNYQEKRGMPRKSIELQEAHDAHEACFTAVQNALKAHQESVEICDRADLSAHKVKDRLVVTIGGDGTMLDASHHIHDGMLLGVNSDPARSVGALCAATAQTFPSLWQQVLEEQVKVSPVTRIGVMVNGHPLPTYALNEILIAHKNPAATSRYQISFCGREAEHKSSGIWVSTAAGSTGSMLSAGGHLQLLHDKRLQYLAREPYFSNHAVPDLLVGFLPEGESLAILSRMETGGYLYFDGAHHMQRLPINARVTIHSQVPPLKLIVDAELEERRFQISKLREQYHQHH